MKLSELKMQTRERQGPGSSRSIRIDTLAFSRLRMVVVPEMAHSATQHLFQRKQEMA